MTTPHHAPIPVLTRYLMVLAGGALAAAVYFAAPVYAASGAPVVHTYFTIAVAVNNNKAVPTVSGDTAGTGSKGSSSSKGGYGGKYGGDASTGTSDFTSQADITYAITVHNITKFPVKNLVVEYHFYNLTTDTDANGTTTHHIEDISDSTNVDIDAGALSKPILTKVIPRMDSASSGGSGGNSGGGRSKTKTTSRQATSVTDLLGYRVEARFNNELVGSTESPMDLKDKLANFAPKTDSSVAAAP